MIVAKKQKHGREGKQLLGTTHLSLLPRAHATRLGGWTVGKYVDRRHRHNRQTDVVKQGNLYTLYIRPDIKKCERRIESMSSRRFEQIDSQKHTAT